MLCCMLFFLGIAHIFLFFLSPYKLQSLLADFHRHKSDARSQVTSKLNCLDVMATLPDVNVVPGMFNTSIGVKSLWAEFMCPSKFVSISIMNGYSTIYFMKEKSYLLYICRDEASLGRFFSPVKHLCY